MVKNWRKKAAAIVALCTFALSLTAVSAKEDTAKEQLHVIFSHDIHSHLDSFRTSFKGKGRISGYAADRRRGFFYGNSLPDAV